MRGDRYSARGSASGFVDQNAYGAGDGAYDYQQPLDGAQPAGFTRHALGNSRRASTPNPVVEAFGRARDAVGGFVAARRGGSGASSAAGRASSAPGRPARAAAVSEGGDYLGVGLPCRLCGNPVDSDQTRCPHCGAFVKPLYTNVFFWVSVAVLVGLVVLLSLSINSCKSTPSIEQLMDDPTSVSTAEVRGVLATAVLDAQATLTAQEANRTYTHYSLDNLESKVGDAKAVAESETSTNSQVVAASQALSNAVASLAPIATDSTAPAYGDLVAAPDSYVGKQISVSGVVKTAVAADGGMTLTEVYVAGNTSQVACVNLYDADATSTIAEGSSIVAYGTMIGLYNGLPVMLADSVQVQ